jgi:hypothetical protein
MTQQFNYHDRAVAKKPNGSANVCGIAENYVIENQVLVRAVTMYTKKTITTALRFCFLSTASI